ncbi:MULTISPECIES: ring-cleaving dioxygenase [unclassified Methylobacterium]|uniref:ring-cleaving dioxygenase n=1 Tax=unclassified Methylobacterium TaxID=2615210 RepID=UPI000CC4986E|nr:MULTISPECIES: ring-cleaving dioxygenase [unclassified Methylobacterium]PIU07512.1 MAG: ring-cleaving dioxygenase [Methylobacterium sp. CG09_land_8_20_14_0_10_71_15]PIU13299.1 MAG: ring-cleaving dioxygenase [Methylobacterium sp. CG08_land_8_20_14_0_20_71_15]GBU17791.1 diguanylate cyclase [Methylobacterium sp.]
MTETGLHHVTAFSGPAERNVGFYTGVLGLRLVKKTVNFDDPGTYHLYYGDETGQPGTILTFFPIAHAAPGRVGVGETGETAFRVPLASIGWWVQRLIEKGVAHETPATAFGEPVLRLRDPDGTMLALVGVAEDGAAPAWSAGGVPVEHAVRGLHGVTLLLDRAAATGRILTDALGFRETGREGSSTRYAGSAGRGAFVTLREVGGFLRGRPGAGSVHHIAFRAADDAAQAAMAERLASEHGLVVTEQRDRQYFRSVYFREPGGVLFEIATDSPGFGVDEPVAELGRVLKLPAFLEPHRATIEQALPAVA